MDFRFHYNCMDITPEQFTLQPSQSQSVNIIPDKNNKCTIYKDSSAVLIGGQSSLHSAEGFLYMLSYSKEHRESPWTCDTDTGSNSYFCHYLSPNSDPSYSTEVPDNKITLLDEEPGRIYHIHNKSTYNIHVIINTPNKNYKFWLKPNQTQDIKMDIAPYEKLSKIEEHGGGFDIGFRREKNGYEYKGGFALWSEYPTDTQIQNQPDRYKGKILNFKCTKIIKNPGFNFCYSITSEGKELGYRIDIANFTNIILSNTTTSAIG